MMAVDFSWISDAAPKDSPVIDLMVLCRTETKFMITDQSVLKLFLFFFESLKGQNSQTSPVF